MSSLKRTIMENNYCHLELFNFREKEQDLVRDEMNPCKITGMLCDFDFTYNTYFEYNFETNYKKIWKIKWVKFLSI